MTDLPLLILVAPGLAVLIAFAILHDVAAPGLWIRGFMTGRKDR